MAFGKEEGMAAVQRKRRLAVILATLGILLLGCAFGGYRYADSKYWLERPVDRNSLQQRMHQEQPVGAGVAETVVFLQRLGFQERNIRIQRYAATVPRAGQLAGIEAWIPQPQGVYQPMQIRARCTFSPGERLEQCNTFVGEPLRPSADESIVEVTPGPAR